MPEPLSRYAAAALLRDDIHVRAATHGPLSARDVAAHFGLELSQAQGTLRRMTLEGRLTRELQPSGPGLWGNSGAYLYLASSPAKR